MVPLCFPLAEIVSGPKLSTRMMEDVIPQTLPRPQSGGAVARLSGPARVNVPGGDCNKAVCQKRARGFQVRPVQVRSNVFPPPSGGGPMTRRFFPRTLESTVGNSHFDRPVGPRLLCHRNCQLPCTEFCTIPTGTTLPSRLRVAQPRPPHVPSPTGGVWVGKGDPRVSVDHRDHPVILLLIPFKVLIFLFGLI